MFLNVKELQLTKKADKFIEKNLYPLLPEFKDGSIVLFGGFVRSLWDGMPFNDIDVFVFENGIEKTRAFLVNFVGIENTFWINEIKFQIHTGKDIKNVLDLVNMADISVSAVVYSYKEKKFYKHDLFQDGIKHKTMKYFPNNINHENIERIEKYRKYGYVLV